MEFVDGGELFDAVQKHGKVPELEAKDLFWQCMQVREDTLCSSAVSSSSYIRVLTRASLLCPLIHSLLLNAAVTHASYYFMMLFLDLFLLFHFNYHHTQGVKYMHAKGLGHRDLSLENAMLSTFPIKGAVKVRERE